jgi:capsular polysaccharide biosynthesis protein
VRLPDWSSGRRGRLVRASTRTFRQQPGRREVLESYDALLAGWTPGEVVLLCGPGDAAPLQAAAARAYPRAHVVALTPERPDEPDGPDAVATDPDAVVPCRNVHQAHAALLRRPAPDLILDDGGCPASWRYAVFLQLLPALVDGGRYVLRDGGASDGPLADRDGESLPELVGRLTAAQADRVPADCHPDDQERVRMLGARQVHGRVLMITKVGHHLTKLREEEVDRALPGRLGPGRHEVLARRPAERFTARATLHSNRPDLDAPFLPEFDVPPRTLRLDRDVVCRPRQLVVAGDAMLPASFHHAQKRRLRNRGSVDAARWYARLDDPTEPTTLPGTWYHLASEFPGHFGHVMTEDLARLWGWDEARQAYGDLKLLVGAGDPAPKPFLLELLEAFGISRTDVLAAPGPVRVERLVTATPQLHNGCYVDPQVDATWSRITDRLADPTLRTPRRIFVTRPPGTSRRCLNGELLEARFEAAGFTVVRPETLALPAQVSLFAGADVVAGYAGSGLFTALASRPGTTCVVFGSESYTAINEWLISAVKGFDHHHFWCPSTRPASGTFDRASFHADFRFDTEHDARRLDDLLERIGA